ncbi:MAG: leucine-rich repeat domain-containing protein [Prevotella sp.]|nr:leucine-rich repeat domain-containing protein [Prevotella sp.]
MEKLLCHLTPPRLLLFIAALLGSNITASADSHCDFTVNNIHYNFISGAENEIEVTYWDYESGRYGGYTNDYTGSVTVPATVSYNSKTYKVTAVGRSAFVECSGLTSVSLPSTITSIGSYAFGDCSKLTTVNVPQSVTNIGNSAFSGCVSFIYCYS